MKRVVLFGIVTGCLGVGTAGAGTAGGTLTINEVSRTGGSCVALQTWRHAGGTEYRIRAIGARVEVLDAAKPDAQPQILGSITLPGKISSLTVAAPGDAFSDVAIAVVPGGVYMVDLTDPRNPLIPANTTDTHGSYTTAKRDGSKVFVLDETALSLRSYLMQADAISADDQIIVTAPTFDVEKGKLVAPQGPGIQIFDTGTTPMTPGAFLPGFPTALGFCNGWVVAGTPFSINVFSSAGGPPVGFLPANFPTRMTSNGTDLAFADPSANVCLVDLANPATPAFRGSVSMANDATYPPEVRDLQIFDRGGGAKVLCATTPGGMASAPYQSMLDPTKWTTTFTGGDALDVAAANGTVAIAWGGNGLEVLWTGPAAVAGGNFFHPDFTRRVDLLQAALGLVGGARPGTAVTPMWWVFASGLGTEVYEIERSATAQVGAILSADVWDFAVSGSKAVALEYPHGFRVYDVADPSSPLLLGTDPSFFLDGRVSLKGDLASIATPTALTFVDISAPATPAVSASIPGSFTDVELFGSRAYAGTATGLEIFDVSNSAQPVRLGGISFSGTSPVYDVEIDRRSLYTNDTTKHIVAWLAKGEDGIRGIDAEDPANPVEFLDYDIGGQARAVDVTGSRIYYANGYDGVGWGDLVQTSFRTGGTTASAGTGSAREMSRPTAGVGTFPNPFRESTTLSFELPTAAEVSLDVLDVTGRRVASLMDGRCGAGARQVAWDGRDDGGRRLAAGVYFVQLRTGETTTTHKVVMAR
ncbi:MAG: FlgD immunoglobulin-like domain containing protein [Candidatus Eiseniibacteriota bacterium]